MLKSVVSMMVVGLLLSGTAGAAASEDSGRNSGKSAMEWRMLPGESLNSLAALFYPKDRRMQQRFVAATVALNRERMQNLAPDQAFDAETTLEIPNLHALSSQAGKPRKRAAAVRHSPKPAKPAEQLSAMAPSSAGHQNAAYEALEKRTEQRQQELAKLNQRLKELEQNAKTMQDSIKANAQPIEAAQGRQLKQAGP